MSGLPNLRATVRRLPCVSLSMAAIACGLQFSPQALGWLQYDRAAIAAGQLWRIVTCHFTHCSFDHLVWDVGVLLVLGLLCEVDDRRRWLRCVTATAVGIPAAIWLLMPDLETYRGLSGIDSALFVLLAATILKDSLARSRMLWSSTTIVLLAGFIIKTGYEYLSGQTVFVDSAASNMVPIPLAHVVGGLIGALTVTLSNQKDQTTGSYQVVGRQKNGYAHWMNHAGHTPPDRRDQSCSDTFAYDI